MSQLQIKQNVLICFEYNCQILQACSGSCDEIGNWLLKSQGEKNIYMFGFSYFVLYQYMNRYWYSSFYWNTNMF